MSASHCFGWKLTDVRPLHISCGLYRVIAYNNIWMGQRDHGSWQLDQACMQSFIVINTSEYGWQELSLSEVYGSADQVFGFTNA